MKFDPIQLSLGTKVEMEHTNDTKVARKIALDHLKEFPDYYTRLLKMEKEAKKEGNQMPEKEIREARTAMIPENIIAKMSIGSELSENEKMIVRKHGKVYVPAHKKNNVVIVRPQLRKLSHKRGNKPKHFR